MFKVYLYIIISLFFSKSREHKLIKKSLIRDSFKLNKKINGSFLFYFSNLKKILLSQIKSEFFRDNKLIILSGDCNNQSDRVNFLQYYDSTINNKDLLFLSYSDLKKFNTLQQKITWFLLTIIFSPFLIFKLFFTKHKGSVGLLLEYPILISNLLNYCKNADYLYYFCIYELETNLVAKFLLDSNQKFSKITSSTPITFYNSIIISDDIIFCDLYQLEEFNHHKENCIFNSFKVWGPENSSEFLSLYKTNKDLPEFDITFYSTASWVRVENGLISFENGILKAEQSILQVIKEFLKNNPNIKFKIALHPKERIKYKEAIEYYNSIFNEINYYISNENERSDLNLTKNGLGVTFFSTIALESIYCGNKVCFWTQGLQFPVINSNLKNICVSNEQELLDLITKSISKTKKEFIVENELKQYVNEECYSNL